MTKYLVPPVPRLLLAIFLALLSSVVGAACPNGLGEKPPASREALVVIEKSLDVRAAECDRDPAFLAWHGAVLNALGQPAAAAAALERALLLDPDFAGAKVDYAEALAALGDAAGASALARELLTRSDVPADLREFLDGRRQQWQQQLDMWRGKGSVALRLGHDSNLNSAPSRDSLTLTLPGGDALLQLSDRFRAQSGSSRLFEVSGVLSRPLDSGGRVTLYGEARQRQGSVVDTNYRQLDTTALWNLPIKSGEAVFALGATDLQFGGEDIYQALRASAARDWSVGDCRPRAGLEIELRRFPTSRTLDGRFAGATAGLVCGVAPTHVFLLSSRYGVDLPDDSRPGGRQQRLDLRLNWGRNLGAGRLETDLLLGHQRDGEGYSALLEHGARRELTRASLRVEYTQKIATDVEGMLSGEVTRQQSNLALFEVGGRSVYLGMRYRF